MKKLGAIILAGLLWGAFPAVAAFADHERSRCYDGYECDGYNDGRGDQGYNDWNSDQRNHNRRNRGAFSPGPFTDSPVTITICAVPQSCPQSPPEEKKR